MKNNIKLTPKQQRVLEAFKTILEKENFKKIPVSDIYCNMTAVNKVVAANWFDRTFNKLEEKGLVEKEDMNYEIKGGHKKGEVVETYSYTLTDLGFEYLGIVNPNKTKEQSEEKVIDAAQSIVNTPQETKHECSSTVEGHISYKFVCKDCNTVIKSNEEYLYNPLTGCYHHKKCGGSHLLLEVQEK